MVTAGGAHEEDSESGSAPTYGGELSELANGELMAVLDHTLLELEQRLFHYSQVGAEVLQMADEGLVLASRARARLSQALSAAQHAESHLQLVGVGDWNPNSTRPSWNSDTRVTGQNPESQQ